jgi:hypothetical protein
MSFDNEQQKKDFIAFVAAILEENCLPLVESEAEVEKAILFAIDYCLDKKTEESK